MNPTYPFLILLNKKKKVLLLVWNASLKVVLFKSTSNKSSSTLTTLSLKALLHSKYFFQKAFQTLQAVSTKHDKKRVHGIFKNSFTY